MSGIEEGMIVKMLMAVNRLLAVIESMAQVVGDNTLAQRMVEIKKLSDRGIVKLQSLYLEVEQESLQITRAVEDEEQKE
jgi:superfamily II RNA helicase